MNKDYITKGILIFIFGLIIALVTSAITKKREYNKEMTERERKIFIIYMKGFIDGAATGQSNSLSASIDIGLNNWSNRFKFDNLKEK